MKLSCKCGNIQIEWDPKTFPLLARKCGCDYCTQQDCDYVSDPESIVRYKILDPRLCKIVQHGTNTANFYECVNCGLVLVTSEIEGTLFSVLNAKALGMSEYLLDQKTHTFDKESIADKLNRRKNKWCKTIAI